MKNKNWVSSIPIAMLTKKFFCHKCGDKLETKAKYRTLKRGDPDYKKHSSMLDMHIVGDIEVTEYDFICPSCNNITLFKEQSVIGRIQKLIGKKVLSQAEIDEHFEKEEVKWKRNEKINVIFFNALCIAALIFVFYLIYHD